MRVAQKESTRSGPAIGVFDSGVGGLSVLRELRLAMPDADLLYVADSAHCPYGSKSVAEIQARTGSIAQFLWAREVDALVVACNTATAAAIDLLRSRFWSRPIVGLEPAVKPAVAATRSGVIGVLATTATLANDRFADLASRHAGEVELLVQPCPGLVEQVEAGDLDGPRTRALLESLVRPLLEQGVDTLVLGCTHYAFLRPVLSDLYGPGLQLIDTGAAVARYTRQLVRGPLHARAVRGSHPEQRTLAWSSDLGAAPLMEQLWGQPLDVQLLPV